MPDTHLAAVRSAEKTTRDLYALFAQLGTVDHPRGAVLSAYRQARRALKGNVGTLEADAILIDLQIAISAALATVYYQAQDVGNEQAARELKTHDIPHAPALMGLEIGDALRATLGIVEAQVLAARLMPDEAMLLGDASRVGSLTPEPVIKDAARFAALLAVTTQQRSTERSVERADAQDQFMRQAIAAIDERTTDCCLRVHGQTVPIDGKFKLTGTPRFADELDAPPFHWYCRSAVALVRKEDKGDPLTRQMRDAARAELNARATAQAHIDDLKHQLADLGQTPDIRIRKDDTQQIKNLRTQLRNWKAKERVEIHPAHARSRR